MSALLIYDRCTLDPRIRRLTDVQCWGWLELVSRCARLDTDTLPFTDAMDALRGSEGDPADLLLALAAAQLLSQEGFEFRLLARGDLWEIDR